MNRCVRLSLLILPMIVGTASSATIHVEADGSGDVATILDAVNAASPGDTVMLADGTYTGSGNREIDITKYIVVQSESGAPEQCVIDCDGTPALNHYGFYIHFVGSPGPVIEGLTIREGAWGAGGAVHIAPSGPGTCASTIRNCQFSENWCSSWGAAIGVNTGASLSLSQCVFTGNSSASVGGALGLYGGSSCAASDCEFSLSQASVKGGAVWARAAEATFADCLFGDNVTSNGGGAIYAEACTLSYDTCRFLSNRSSANAGVVYLDGGSLEMTGCTTCGNKGGNSGAWLGSSSTTVTITGCSFVADTASIGVFYIMGSTSLALENTAIAFGVGCEALYCSGTPSPTAVCCDIYGNQSGNWMGCLSGMDGSNGNFSEDPLFCDIPSRDLTVEDCSPCLAANNTCGVDIGAYASGCACGEATEPITWGAVKALFK
jgi:predicted outer membrane repeat protein